MVTRDVKVGFDEEMRYFAGDVSEVSDMVGELWDARCRGPGGNKAQGMKYSCREQEKCRRKT